MPRSLRGDFLKTGLSAGIATAVLIATLFIGWGLLKSAQYEREAHNQAREYAAHSNDQIRQSCVRTTLRDAKQCIAEARHEQRKNEREEQDLVAQRKAALWAYVMGAAAVIGMGLSVIGVILVWTTFRETKEANVIAKREAARAEAEALALRKHAIQTERAVLAIRNMTADNVAEGDAFIRLRLSLRNDGQSNAWGIQVGRKVKFSRVFPASRYEMTPPLPVIALAGREAMTPEFRIRIPKSFPAFVFGFVEYTTAHDATFKSFFCYRFDGVPVEDGYGGGSFYPVDASRDVQLPPNT